MSITIINGNFIEKTFGVSLLAWSISKIGLNVEKELESKNLLTLSDKQKVVLTEVHKFSTRSLWFHTGMLLGVLALGSALHVKRLIK